MGALHALKVLVVSISHVHEVQVLATFPLFNQWRLSSDRNRAYGVPEYVLVACSTSVKLAWLVLAGFLGTRPRHLIILWASLDDAHQVRARDHWRDASRELGYFLVLVSF